MLTKEFENRDDYLAFVNDPQIKDRIHSVFLYWYEGKGRRETKILPGRNVEAYFKTLSLEEKIKQCFMMPPTLKDAYRKDYEESGGMTDIDGKPEDAVIVVEYDEAP